MQILCSYCTCIGHLFVAPIGQLFVKYCANIILMLCKCYTNIVLILGKLCNLKFLVTLIHTWGLWRALTIIWDGTFPQRNNNNFFYRALTFFHRGRNIWQKFVYGRQTTKTQSDMLRWVHKKLWKLSECV